MKTYTLIVISLFIQLFSVVAQEAYLDATRQGEDFSKNGKYQEAYDAYTKAIGINANDYRLWVNRGVSQMNLKRYDDAVKDFNQALKLHANDVKALQGRASSKAMLKDYKGAIADYSNILTQKPTDYSIVLERGKSRLYDGDIPGSLVDFKECLNRSFKPAESNYWIGVAYFAQKEFRRAAEAFEKASSLDKTLMDAYYRGALCCAELGLYTQAVEKLNPMIQTKPSDANLYILRATLNIKAGNQGQAKTDMVKINELKPGSVDVIMLRIMSRNSLSDYEGALSEMDSLLLKYPSGNDLLFLERGKALYPLYFFDEAEDMLERSMTLCPENVEVYQQQCLMNIERKNFRLAISYANKAIQINNQQANNWYLKGRAFIGLEQGEEAFVAINQGLELDGEHPEVGQHYLGMAYYAMRKTSEAMGAFEKALSINATYAPVRIDRARILLNQGKVQEALTDYQTVLKNDPNNVTAHCGQGFVYLQQKKYEQALQAFSKALTIRDRYVDAYTGRGQAYVQLDKQDKAMGDFTLAIKFNDEYADAYYHRGLLYKKMDNLNAAVDDFKMASSLGNEKANEVLKDLGEE